MGEAVSIRLARAAERDELERLQHRASLQNPDDRRAILAHPDAIRLPAEQIDAGQVWVAESGGAVAGFSVILPREDGDAELDGLFVEPELWRSGLGRALVEHAESQARASGAQALHAIGNPHAEPFYRATGFTQTGTVELRFGRGMLMRKPLGGPGR